MFVCLFVSLWSSLHFVSTVLFFHTSVWANEVGKQETYEDKVPSEWMDWAH